MTRFASILEAVGNTPAVKINRLAPDGIDLYVKVEAFNPLGSVKDRLALGVIEDAEKRGALKPGQTVVEATSGNTGIGLAMVCAAKGYPLVVTMAETFSVERRRLMRFLGAKVILTPAAERGTGMVRKASELAEKHGWFLTRQFENEANADMHSRTTAREIINDFAGVKLDYWVTGFGTGGTLKGVGRVLAKERPETKIVVCEPADAPMLTSGKEQARNADGSPSAGHPAWNPHPLQGWSPDFIPKAHRRPPSRLASSVASSRFRTPKRCNGAGVSRAKRGFSSGRRQARRSPARSSSRMMLRKARRSSACCPTPASVTSARRSSPRSCPR